MHLMTATSKEADRRLITAMSTTIASLPSWLGVRVIGGLLMLLVVLLPSVAQLRDFQLHLRAEVIGKRYCAVDDFTSSLLVRFRVHLANRGEVPIVLDRSIYPVLLVSQTLRDVSDGEHEFELNGPDVFENLTPGEKLAPEAANEQRIVRGGETLETDTMETTIPTLRKRRSKELAVAPGSHYVQLVLEEQIQGTDIFTRVTSQPIKIIIEQHPKLEVCH